MNQAQVSGVSPWALVIALKRQWGWAAELFVAQIQAPGLVQLAPVVVLTSRPERPSFAIFYGDAEPKALHVWPDQRILALQGALVESAAQLQTRGN